MTIALTIERWMKRVSLVVLLLGLMACREPRVDRLVLVTIDTLRADHLASFGHPLDPAPFIDGLAAQGLSFHRAYAQAAATGPSHSSIFTSLYPIQHGVQANGRILDESFTTLAEALSAAGYRTAAFVSTNAHFKWGGMDQGFDVYDEQPAEPEGSGRARAKRYRRADDTVDVALAWLETVDPSEKLFVWLHLFDPHARLRPPLEHFEEIKRQAQQIQIANLIPMLEPSHRKISLPGNRARVLKYDAEIRFADAELRRFFDVFSVGEAKDLWVITSDHGQGLGTHGIRGHAKHVYNDQLHVPLIFYSNTGEIPARVVDDVLVEHVDIAPTLADWMGLDFDDQAAPTQGESLAGFLEGRSPKRKKRFSFAQSSRYRKPKRRELRNYEPPKYAIQDLRYKFILNSNVDNELFDLTEDPYEQRSLQGNPRLRAEQSELEERLASWLEELSTGLEAESVAAEAIERLKALGYLQ
ncbi:MAG: sulfatase [Thermoanaerobaculia bacterium]